ncbi:MAG: putative peptidoglycan glycosyltransferase FtsW [Patescibacteria group bacterium]|nr:putative peptidoglycan glycosyltransferase FtsW [Patescibacteria group bacterium]
MRNKNKSQFDYVLAGIVFSLIIIAIIALVGTSAQLSYQKFGDSAKFLTHQLVFGFLLGLIACVTAFKIPLIYFKKYAGIFLLINLFLLLLVFIPGIGFSSHGSSRWVDIGFASFQPSEFLKISFILYLSLWIASKRDKNQILNRKPRISKNSKLSKINLFLFKLNKETNKSLFAFLCVIFFISAFLIAQPDVSTLGIILLTATIIYFCAGTPLWHIILIGLLGISSLMILIKTTAYRDSRLKVFLNPNFDPMGIGYQIKQSLITIGSGGLFGVGLGMSKQKNVFLPESMSDSIFSIFAEEMGFIGALFLIFLFLGFLWRGFEIAKKSSDKFYSLTAIGITTWIVIQAFINISSMIGVLPLTGIPLPFFSYGGSHIIAELIGVGILFNISKNSV